MSQSKSIKLHTSCILNVPFEIYEKDFSFIVNGQEFKTSKIVSDLLSPYICKIHSSDPTFDRFIINTKHNGDFSHVLQLINFETNQYPINEISFLIEVISHLDNDFIEIETDETNGVNEEITIDNVFTNIFEHEQNSKFYKSILSKEKEFISTHFYEICEEKEEELIKLKISSLYSILINENLQLKNEDQLLKFINKLYATDESYSILYETVLFENVSTTTICEFVNIYNIDMMTRNTWENLSKRLCKEINKEETKETKENSSNNDQNKRYKEETKINKGISFSQDNEYEGIIKYLMKKSYGQIENEINITASSIAGSYQPRNVTLFDDQSKFFESQCQSNNWLCYDFKEHRIIPSAYTIRTYPSDANYHHPKSWVVECSNDNKSWETVDEEKDCPYLNGKNYSHTFTMNHQKSTEFRYIRIRLTGLNWSNANYLQFDSFEIYGQFI